MKRNGFRAFFILLVATLSGCIVDSSDSNGSREPPPGTPEYLQLKAVGPSSVRLSWSDSTDIRTQHTVERSVDGSAFEEIAALASNAHEYEDDSVTPDRVYVYKVYAENGPLRSDSAMSVEYRHPYLDACNSVAPSLAAANSIFYDLPVTNMTYVPASEYKVTDNNGAFTWDQTSTLFFSFGYVDVGGLKSGDKAGLMSLVRNIGGNEDVTLNNLLRFLMALDEDHDTGNGIQLPCSLSLAYGNIDFTADYAAFAEQETVVRLTNGMTLPTYEEARNLYNQNLFRDYVGDYSLAWNVVLYGMFPLTGTMDIHLDIDGKVTTSSEMVHSAEIDPHRDYRLKIVDMTPLYFLDLGFYKSEIVAHIRPDHRVDGEIVLKSFSLGDFWGDVVGVRTGW